MSDLQEVLQAAVDDGAVPGAVALVARGDRAEVAVAGPMARDSVFRIASSTKPVTAAAVMMLVDDGRIALDDEIRTWLPELASPGVVRTPASPVDDVVAAHRPITVADLLTFRAGWGFPSDFSRPAVAPLLAMMNGDPLRADAGSDAWLATLADIPLLHQPGETWLYNTCADVLGVLVERVAGQPFAGFLAERLFGPLGMADTGFTTSAADRLVDYFRPTPDGGRELVDDRDVWSRPPAFASGAGGLVSTVDDWWAFGRMLLADGAGVLSPESVRLMTTDHLTGAQRDASTLFLEGQGWGFGGSVDVAAVDPWNVAGRYGWVGGTGTATHVVPATGTVTVLFSQVAMTGPTPPALMRAFWTCAAG